MMRCIRCGGQVRTLDTRDRNDNKVVYRRRECLECGKKFSTFEFSDVYIARVAPNLITPQKMWNFMQEGKKLEGNM